MAESIQAPKMSLRKRILYTTILGGLAVAFVIGDITSYLDSSPKQQVAKIGDKTITLQMLDEEYQRLKQNYQGMPAIWLAMQNLPQKALQNIIEKTVFSEYARTQGIMASKPDLAKTLQSLPFLNVDGTTEFSKEKYFSFLERIGLSEKEFLALLQDDIVRDLLLKNLVIPFGMPENMMEILKNHTFEQRKIAYLVAPAIKNVPFLQQDDATLKAYYEKHQKEFSRPETRDVSYLIFSPSTLKQAMPSDKDIKALYEKNSDSYKTPEKRHIYQISFDTKEQAGQVVAALKQGVSFADMARKLGKSQDDIDLGILEKAELSDKIADTLFSLPENGTSTLLQTDFGYAIYHIHGLQKQSVTPLSEVRDSLVADASRQAFLRFKDENLETIEDDIAGGSTIHDISQKYHLTPVKFKNLNALGERIDTLEMVITNPELIGHLFSLKQGEDADIFDIGDDSFVMARVDKIDVQRGQTFEEAKDLLVEHDKTAKIAAAQKKQALEVAEKIKAGDSLETIAQTLNVPVRHITIQRAETNADLSPELVNSLFATKKKEQVIFDQNADHAEPITYGMIETIEVAPASEEEQAAFDEKMQSTFHFEAYQLLQERLQKQLGLGIKQDVYTNWLASLPQEKAE